jgi:hypothetical protein
MAVPTNEAITTLLRELTGVGSCCLSSVSETPVNSRSKVVIASLVGTAIEFFDFYIYATAAVIVFPHIFFASDCSVATVASPCGKKMCGKTITAAVA